MNRDRINQLADEVEHWVAALSLADTSEGRNVYRANMRLALNALRDAALSAPSEAEPPELPECFGLWHYEDATGTKLGEPEKIFSADQMLTFRAEGYRKGVADGRAWSADEAYQRGLAVTRGDIAQLKHEHAEELAAIRAQPAAQPAQEMSDEQIDIHLMLPSDVLDEIHSKWRGHPRSLMRDVEAAVHKHLAILAADRARGVEVPEGWRLVPMEPTQAMIEAGYDAQGDDNETSLRLAWPAMVATAPSNPPSAGQGEEV